MKREERKEGVENINAPVGVQENQARKDAHIRAKKDTGYTMGTRRQTNKQGWGHTNKNQRKRT